MWGKKNGRPVEQKKSKGITLPEVLIRPDLVTSQGRSGPSRIHVSGGVGGVQNQGDEMQRRGKRGSWYRKKNGKGS